MARLTLRDPFLQQLDSVELILLLQTVEDLLGLRATGSWPSIVLHHT